MPVTYNAAMNKTCKFIYFFAYSNNLLAGVSKENYQEINLGIYGSLCACCTSRRSCGGPWCHQLLVSLAFREIPSGMASSSVRTSVLLHCIRNYVLCWEPDLQWIDLDLGLETKALAVTFEPFDCACLGLFCTAWLAPHRMLTPREGLDCQSRGAFSIVLILIFFIFFT